MWRQIYDYGKQLFTLTQKTERNQQELQDLRQEVKELTAAVQQLYYEQQRTNDHMKHWQETSTLRLENTLLKFERQLPRAGENNKS